MNTLKKIFVNIKSNIIGIIGILLALLGMKIILADDVRLEGGFQFLGDLLFLIGVIMFFYRILKK